MTKMSKMLVALTLLLVAFSIPALAWEVDADVTWGDNHKNGTWGFVYNRGYDDEGNFEDGEMTSYLRKEGWGGPWNISRRGAYIADGQSVTTIFGSRLGVDYSPYIAKFHDESRTLGYRVSRIEYDLDVVDLSFDGTWAFAAIDDGPGTENWWKVPSIEARRNDFLLNAGADFDLLDANLDVAMLVYQADSVKEDAEAGDLDYHFNFAVETGLTPLPGLDLTGLYARYSQYGDYLYEVTANYEVLPETLWVRAGHRDSEFEHGYEDLAIVGGHRASAAGSDTQRYIADLDPLKDLYNRDFSINVGATYKFDYDVTSNQIDIDYDTTNPAQRGDLDDKVTLKTNTDVLGYNLWQEFSIMFPDDDSEDDVVNEMLTDEMVYDRNNNRLDYAVRVTTPKYDLPVPMLDEVFAIGKVNFDWDQNYVADNRNQTILALELGIVQDVWRLHGMEFGAIVAYDMVSDNMEIEDAFKYALIARYDAPKGIKFRLEYLNSADYANEDAGVHGEKLNDRYDNIRYYDNSKFHGIRFTVGFPI